MTEQDITPTPDATPEPTPSAETQNTSREEARIPKARFDQVLQERNELMARLEKLEAADKQRREAEMTDLERAKAAADEAAARAAQLEQQVEAERRARLHDRRDNALAQSLAAAGAVDADDLLIVLHNKYAADLKPLMADDGTLDSDAIKALVEKVKAERGYAFQSGGPGSPSNRGGQVPTPTNNQAAQLAKQVKEQYGYDLDAESLGKRLDMYRDILE